MPEISLPTKITQDEIKTNIGSNADPESESGSVHAKLKNIKTILATTGKVLRSKVFDVPGTYSWVVPDGVSEVYVTGCGAGAGGSSGSHNLATVGIGKSGGATSFGSLLTMSGGSVINGGQGSPGVLPGGKGGAGSFGPYVGGGGGGGGFSTGGQGGGNENRAGGVGGGVGGTEGGNTLSYGDGTSGGIGAGGGGGSINGTNSDLKSGAGGGAGGYVYDFPVTVTPGQNVTITIGVGGTGGVSNPPNTGAGKGGNGGNGLLTVKWWE
ncbi:hypothetical protein HYI36_18620 [Bacillus sp. Gen3]|nr:hypothetical protein [Bacillus sp. Gen3]